MNEEELEKPKLIWKGSVGEALKTGRLTQEQVDKWNMEEEMGEDYMNGFEEGFQKGKLEERNRIEDLIIDMRFKIQNRLNNYFNIDTRTLLFIYNKELSQLQKEIGDGVSKE